MREAARLADLGLDRAVETAGPGALEGGRGLPGEQVIIGSGPRALLFRSAAGMMRTLVVGEASGHQRISSPRSGRRSKR